MFVRLGFLPCCSKKERRNASLRDTRISVTEFSSWSKNPSYLKCSHPQRERFDLKSGSQMELRLGENLSGGNQDWASGFLPHRRERKTLWKLELQDTSEDDRKSVWSQVCELQVDEQAALDNPLKLYGSEEFCRDGLKIQLGSLDLEGRKRQKAAEGEGDLWMKATCT